MFEPKPTANSFFRSKDETRNIEGSAHETRQAPIGLGEVDSLVSRSQDQEKPRGVWEGEESKCPFVIKGIEVEDTTLPHVENTADFHLVLDENESLVIRKCTFYEQ